MKKQFYLSIIAIFMFVYAISIVKVLNFSNLSIALIVPLYPVLIILLNTILVYSNPSKWMFRLRFVVYSLVYSLGFGLGMSFFNLFEKHYFSVIGFVIYTLSFSVLSFFVGTTEDENYFRFKKLIRKTGNSNVSDLALTDSAYYVDSELFRTLGRLILENGRLYFYSANENRCLFNAKLSDINAVIEKSSVLKIPKGLDFLKNETKIYMKLPYYWLNVIENAKINAAQ